MDYGEAVKFLAERILREQSENPYLVLVNGLPQSGKTYFCREVTGAIGFKKKGLVTKPHDIERRLREHQKSRYYLIENHDAHLMVINMNLNKLFNKGIDFDIFILNDLSRVLSKDLTLEMVLERFDLIVENPSGKFDFRKDYQ